jgi:hypothetical protein
MRRHLAAVTLVLAAVCVDTPASGDTLRWVPSQVDADAQVSGNTDEVQLLISAAYLRVFGAPRTRPDSRAAGIRVGLGVTGQVGGAATNRCTLGVDCFIARAGPTLQVEWSSGDVKKHRVHSDRALFARVTPHMGWVDVDDGLGSFELGVSGGVGMAFAVTGKNSLSGNAAKTIVNVQALGTIERGRVFLGVALGVSLR